MSLMYIKHVHEYNFPYVHVASMTVGATGRQDAYLISSISTLVASHFNSSFRTIITVYESVSENV